MAIFLIFLTSTTFSSTNKMDNKNLDKIASDTALLMQPIVKQKFCAKQLGYIAYQNSLSAVYLSGNKHNKVNLVKSYAWGLVAFYQIQKTNNKKIIGEQKRTLRYISKKMSPAQRKMSHQLASQIIKKYGKSWLSASDNLKMKNFPTPCSISFIGIENPANKNTTSHSNRKKIIVSFQLHAPFGKNYQLDCFDSDDNRFSCGGDFVSITTPIKSSGDAYISPISVSTNIYDSKTGKVICSANFIGASSESSLSYETDSCGSLGIIFSKSVITH